MSASFAIWGINYAFKGMETNPYALVTGFDSGGPVTLTISGLPDGMAYETSASGTYTDTLTLTGSPTLAGIFDVTVVATGPVSAAPVTITRSSKLVVEGDGVLAYYHIDWRADPPDVRNAVDLQYDVYRRQFKSGTVDLAQGLDLTLGETLRLHAIISRSGTNSRGTDNTPLLPAAAPDPLTLIIRPENQFDAPPFLVAAAAGTEDMELPPVGEFETRPVAYLDVSIGNRRLERLFRQLNKASGPDASSAALPGVLQLAFTLDGRQHITPPLPVRINQPYAR